MRRNPLLFAAALVLAFTLPSHADTLTTNFSVNFTGLTGPQENLFGITEFDPRLGTLNSITATLSGYVAFVPQSPGNSVYQLDLTSPYGDIFRQNYTASSVIAISTTFTNVGGYINCCAPIVNHLILDPDVEVTGGSASTVASGSSNVPTSLQGTFTYNYTPTPTPEPSTLILLGSGILATAGAVRKRLLAAGP